MAKINPLWPLGMPDTRGQVMWSRGQLTTSRQIALTTQLDRTTANTLIILTTSVYENTQLQTLPIIYRHNSGFLIQFPLELFFFLWLSTIWPQSKGAIKVHPHFSWPSIFDPTHFMLPFVIICAVWNALSLWAFRQGLCMIILTLLSAFSNGFCSGASLQNAC